MSTQHMRRESVKPLQVLKSACMAAFGVQKDRVRRRDFLQGRPRDFIMAGLVVTGVLVAALVGVVKLVLLVAAVPGSDG